MFKDQIAELIPQFFEYIDAEIEQYAGFLPKVPTPFNPSQSNTTAVAARHY